MKSYFILNCPNQAEIANSLYDFFKEIESKQKIDQFWTNLSRKEIVDYFSRPSSKILKQWFDGMNLRVKDMSFTLWKESDGFNNKDYGRIHQDAPPVIAKINFPVLNTKDTFNIWYENNGNEIDRIECTKPIVLRSNILHNVHLGPQAKLPRIQFSFCFYKEPINLLM